MMLNKIREPAAYVVLCYKKNIILFLIHLLKLSTLAYNVFFLCVCGREGREVTLVSSE